MSTVWPTQYLRVSISCQPWKHRQHRIQIQTLRFFWWRHGGLELCGGDSLQVRHVLTRSPHSLPCSCALPARSRHAPECDTLARCQGTILDLWVWKPNSKSWWLHLLAEALWAGDLTSRAQFTHLCYGNKTWFKDCFRGPMINHCLKYLGIIEEKYIKMLCAEYWQVFSRLFLGKIRTLETGVLRTNEWNKKLRKKDCFRYWDAKMCFFKLKCNYHNWTTAEWMRQISHWDRNLEDSQCPGHLTLVLQYMESSLWPRWYALYTFPHLTAQPHWKVHINSLISQPRKLRLSWGFL